MGRRYLAPDPRVGLALYEPVALLCVALGMTKAKSARGRGSVQRVPLVEYHIVPNGKRWDVERDDAFIGSFAYDVHTAVGLATAAALRDQHNGMDVMVCVQEPSGHCRKVWP